MDVQTYGRTICLKIVITTGRDYGPDEWINKFLSTPLYKNFGVKNNFVSYFYVTNKIKGYVSTKL